ncbi:MAG: DUF438 domain-containing protein [Candidatus Odinarchaeia archaeon]
MNPSHREKVDKKEAIKKLMKELHEGADIDEIKKKFRALIKDVSPMDISQVEEELVKEGMPREKF